MNVRVNDQDEALEFSTKSLGMEVRDDVTVAEMGNVRWLTVAPPQSDVALALMTVPGPASTTLSPSPSMSAIAERHSSRKPGRRGSR